MAKLGHVVVRIGAPTTTTGRQGRRQGRPPRASAAVAGFTAASDEPPVHMASGSNYADALTASALAAKTGEVVDLPDDKGLEPLLTPRHPRCTAA